MPTPTENANDNSNDQYQTLFVKTLIEAGKAALALRHGERVTVEIDAKGGQE